MLLDIQKYRAKISLHVALIVLPVLLVSSWMERYKLTGTVNSNRLFTSLSLIVILFELFLKNRLSISLQIEFIVLPFASESSDIAQNKLSGKFS